MVGIKSYGLISLMSVLLMWLKKLWVDIDSQLSFKSHKSRICKTGKNVWIFELYSATFKCGPPNLVLHNAHRACFILWSPCLRIYKQKKLATNFHYIKTYNLNNFQKVEVLPHHYFGEPTLGSLIFLLFMNYSWGNYYNMQQTK